jgi:hypothetical protein
MKSAEFITEYIKFQKVDAKPRKLSTVEQLCAGKVKKGDTVYVGPEYEHSVFIRAGEKFIHIHNYVTNQNEAVEPKDVYTKEGFKYIPLLGKK